MNKDTLLIIATTLITAIIAPVVLSILGKKKTNAEVHNVNIGGEINLSKGWEEYATEQKADRTAMREEFLSKISELKAESAVVLNNLQLSFNKLAKDYLELQTDSNEMKKELQQVKSEKESLAGENTVLVNRVQSLEKQVSEFTLMTVTKDKRIKELETRVQDLEKQVEINKQALR